VSLPTCQPDACADSSAARCASRVFVEEVRQARAAFNAVWPTVSTSFRNVNVSVRVRVLLALRSSRSARVAHRSTRQSLQVTGVGFFDNIHGQTGVAPNGIECKAADAIVSQRMSPPGDACLRSAPGAEHCDQLDG
jgi:hypothetical protein